MKLFGKLLFSLVLILVIVYFSGPKADFKKVDNKLVQIKYPIEDLEYMIDQREAKVEGIKDDNQSQFYWIDSLQKTEYAVVYLHGFSASHGECQPILTNFAERYGCNSYYPRLYKHGLEDVDVMKDLTPKGLMDSAKEAIAIGKSIGEKLIVISTSTGSALAFYLAANDPDIHALISTSPNFDLFDTRSQLLVQPWGKQIFRKMMGSNYRQWEAPDFVNRYWTTKNRIEAHIAIRDLLDQTMKNATFQAITQPVYISYYFKDEDNMDNVISVDAIRRFAKELSTPDSLKMVHPVANAQGHVISSQYMNENWEDVQDSIFVFAEQKLGLRELVKDSLILSH